MGYLFTEREKGMKDIDWLNQCYSSTGRFKDCSRGSVNPRVLYALYERPDNKLEPVIGPLSSYKDRVSFNGWKEMSECEIPIYYDCPNRIFKQLIHPSLLYDDNFSIESALKWREKVIETQKHIREWKNLKPGDFVLFNKDMFNDTPLWQVSNRKNCLFPIKKKSVNDIPGYYHFSPAHYADKVLQVFNSVEAFPNYVKDLLHDLMSL